MFYHRNFVSGLLRAFAVLALGLILVGCVTAPVGERHQWCVDGGIRR